MSSAEVVDLSLAPSRTERRRLWLRVGTPIGGVLLVIAAILAIALYTDRVNRTGALALSKNLLAELQARIDQQVSDYLDPATRAALLARDMVTQNLISNPPAALQAYAASALRQIPQIDAMYVADAAGNFMMVRRGTAGGTATKVIRNEPGPRQVAWFYRDAAGEVTRIEPTPKDDYDPRTRGWYQGALSTNGVFWSNAYIFFTARAPGITAAIRYRNPSGGVRVFGVDITLKALSSFLASLKIGRGGRAVIIDDTGHLIAAPDSARLLRGSGNQLTAARLDELGDPVLTGAYDRFRVEGYGQRLITVNGERIVAIAAHLPAAAHKWSLLIVVPERDFIGFVATNSRRALALSLVVVALTALLAGFLVRQGLRADRTARLLLDRGHAVERQRAAFARLAGEPDLMDPTREAPMQALTKTLAELSAAQRVSVWRVSSNRNLRCEDAYESESAGHVGGLELARAELPQFFTALASGEVISSPDAANDRRTAELHRVLMHPFGSRALTAIPVMGAESLRGAILFEDATRLDEADDILPAIANMLAIRMRSNEDRESRRLTDTAPETHAAQPLAGGERSYEAELTLYGLDTDSIGADVFPAVAVTAIRFGDPAALATRRAAGEPVLADRVVEALQEIAAIHDIPYMKLVGLDLVAAAGFTAGDKDAVVRIADGALAARERCLELFEDAGQSPTFGIGIDVGIAVGSQVGRQPRLFNLWGEAVRTAEAMASTAGGAGGIQVSESAYRGLRQQFLFRPRGSFYLPRVGAARTFVLASRL